MIKWPYIIGILLFPFWTFAADSLRIEMSRQEPIPVAPGRPLTLALRIQSTGQHALSLEAGIQVPEGWQVISIEPKFSLIPGGVSLQLISIQAPINGTAGQYELSYNLKHTSALGSGSQIKKITLEIPVYHALAIEAAGVPGMVMAGKTVEGKFIVRNLGNTTVRVRAEASNCILADDSNFELPAFGLRELKVEVRPSVLQSKVNRHSFRLSAIIANTDQKPVTAYQSVQVIPDQRLFPPEKQYIFPFQAQLSYLGRRNNGEFAGGMQLFFHTKGAIDTEKMRHIEISLRGPDRFGLSVLGWYDEYFAQYTGPSTNIWIGDKNFSLTPLTEYARFGRGIDVNWKIGQVEIGGFAQKPRFFQEITAEWAGYAKYRLGNNHLIGAHFLQQQLDGGGMVHLGSLTDAWQIFHHTFLEAEVAHGSKGAQSGQALLARLSSQPLKSLNLNGTIITAGHDFPGYYSNSTLVNGVANLLLGTKWQLWANLNRNERQVAQDTLFGVAPITHQWQAGVQYRQNQIWQAQGYVRRREVLDRSEMPKFHYRETGGRIQINRRKSMLDISVSGEAGNSINYLAPADDGRTAIFYRTYGDVVYRLGERHQVRAFFSYNNHNRYTLGRQQQWIGGISANSWLGVNSRLYLQIQNAYLLEEYYRDRSLFEFRWFQRFLSQHEISLVTRYALLQRTENRADFSFSLSYSWLSGFSPHTEKTTGSLSGWISDDGAGENGGIIVYINGQMAVTDDKGFFIVKNLPPGEHTLIVDPSSLKFQRMLSVQSPLRLVIKPGKETLLNLSLVAAGRIKGKIIWQPPLLPVELVIELNNGEHTIRQLTAPDGSYVFGNVQPGRWQLRVLHEGLPERYLIDRDVAEVQIVKGQVEQIDFTFRMRERQIRFAEGWLILKD